VSHIKKSSLFKVNKSTEENDPDTLQLLDESDSVWVNFWRAEAKGKLVHVGVANR
jgi:hypothetical protein